jgi:ribosomal protein S18 acetylase RimI-like enzyme
MTIEKVIIEPYLQEDIDEVAGLLARAFTTEPNNLEVFRGERNLEKRQKPLFMRILRTFPGITIVAKKDSTIVGVLCMSKWPQCHMPLLKIFFYLTQMLSVLRAGVLREMKIRVTWSKHDPKQPHWHIGPIGVEPAFQGKGIGSMLMNYFCDLADTEHQAAYLETDNENNVRFYQRFNFSVTRSVIVNGVRNSFMWRPVK